MQKFTDMHGRTICDGAEVLYNGRFPSKIPETKRIRKGIAIIDGDKLVYAVDINNQLQGIGLYWDFDGEPCHDLILIPKTTISSEQLDYNLRQLVAKITYQAAKDYCESESSNKRLKILTDLQSSYMDYITDGTSVAVAEQLEKHSKEIAARLRRDYEEER